MRWRCLKDSWILSLESREKAKSKNKIYKKRQCFSRGSFVLYLKGGQKKMNQKSILEKAIKEGNLGKR